MDIDHLKMILETIESVGGDTKDVVVWYFALFYGAQILKYVLWFSFGLSVLLVAKRGILAVAYLDTTVYKIAEQLGYHRYGEWKERDTITVMKRITELQDVAKQ